MPPWLSIGLLSLVLGFCSGWKVHDWKTNSEARELEVVADDKAEKHEQFKEKERVRYVTITKTVDRIVTKPFYLPSEQCLDDDGLRQLREAIDPSLAASAVPASGASQ